MRYIIPLFICICFLAFSCEPSSPPAAEEVSKIDTATAETAIQQLVADAFDDIWSALDTNSLQQFHTDDFLLLENGLVWTNDSIINYQCSEMLRMKEYGYQRTNRFEFIKTEVTENVVWTSYHNYGTWTTGEEITGKAHWLESAVAIKTEEGWRLQMLHSTPVREE